MSKLEKVIRKRLPGWASALLVRRLKEAMLAVKQDDKPTTYDHVGLFIRLPDEVAVQFPPLDGDDSPAHVTLFYLGKATQEQCDKFTSAISPLLRGIGSIELTLGPCKEFQNAEGQTVRYSPIESGGELEDLHAALRTAVQEAIPEWVPTYPEYKPHATIEYVNPGETPKSQADPRGRWEASAVELWGAGTLVSYGLTEPVWLDAPVPTVGPAEAKIAFIGAAASLIDGARRRPFSGPDGAEFIDTYLRPLGLKRCDTMMTNIIPEPLVGNPTAADIEKWRGWATNEVVSRGPSVVVALGKIAASELGAVADYRLPHPSVVRRWGDSGEVGRKLRRIKRDLRRVDNGRINVKITKADTNKRIVYGVVLDPYGANGPEADYHGDWNPPAAIERTAHKFLKGPRIIGLQHEKRARAVVVESHVEQYPTRADYLAAINNQPHAVWRRKFGGDTVHSGSWILGVELEPAEWELYLEGSITAFSPGGMGKRTPIARSQMPAVRFIDLVEVPAA